MPIKSCKQCGLKVLVDASQGASDDYTCPRCAPAAAAPAPKPSGGGRRSSVKVTCPYCGAAFSGSVPSRPAKGGCPVCQKELVLLPDGTIQAAATFNLGAWQKTREPKKSGASPAPVEEARGGSTILDVGGPPARPPSAADDLDMAIPGGLGGETMLGMGGHGPASPPELPPDIDEPPPPPPAPEAREEPEPALPTGGDELGGETILDMGGPPPGEEPPPTIEEKPEEQDLLSEAMPGMDRPPSAETPVELPPPPPPLPEPKEEAEPVLPSGEPEEPPPEDPEPRETIKEEQAPATMTSLPGDLGGTTMLGIGGSGDEPQMPEPIPTIEEPTPEAVPILAKDLGDDPSPTPIVPDDPDEPKPYVYGPISRKPRAPVPPPPPPSPAAAPVRSMASMPLSPPPPPSSIGPPLLGSDFRIASAPPEPKPPSIDRPHEGSRPTKAGPASEVRVRYPRPSFARTMVAWLILLLPVAVGMMAHTMRKDERVDKVLKTFSNEALRGFKYVDGEIQKAIKKQADTPPAPPAPPPTAPPAPPPPPKEE